MIIVYIKKKESSQISNLTTKNIKELNNEYKLNVIRKKKIKIRAAINEKKKGLKIQKERRLKLRAVFLKTHVYLWRIHFDIWQN